MKDCIFCRIVKGELPSHKVFENKNYLAFLDINPLNKGHLLVIPKKHYRWVWQVENAGKYWSIANKLAKAVIKTLKPKTVFFITAGYEVPHAHIHVVPRFINDGHNLFLRMENKKNIKEKEMKEIVDKIYKEISHANIS